MFNKETESQTGGRIPWRVLGWSLAAALLLLPLAAMQFTDEVDWSGSDFVVFGLMLASVGAILEGATRVSHSNAYFAGAAIAALTAFFTVWSNLAVGIVGNEANPLNLVFYAVLILAFAIGFLGRFRAQAMARAMYAAAVAQGAIALVLVVLGHTVVLITLFFLAAWLVAARLFERAAAEG